MTDHDDLANRVEELEKRLRAYEEANERFAGTINELNNLLAAMKGHAQLSSMDLTEVKARELVKVVLDTVGRVQELIQRTAAENVVNDEIARMLQVAPDPSQISVLVVDDEVLIRSLLYEILIKAGYNVTMAGSGSDAIEESGNQVFDVILMDFRLGDMDGVQAFRAIREMQPACKVVFLTGDPSIREIQSIVLKEGADGFITKPFDLNEIEQAVARLVSMSA